MDQKKEQILDAALQCFARYGAHKATVDDIAAALGMKKASLYYYYKNKEALFSDAFEREAIRFYNSVKPKLDMQKNAADKIYTLVYETMRYFHKRVEMLEINIKAMVEEHSMFYNVHQNLRKKNIDFIAEIIQEGIDNKEFIDKDARKMADTIRLILDANRFRYLHSMTTFNLSQKEFKKFENESIYILDLIINGIKVRT